MNKDLKYGFFIHIFKYLGIALVSGSIVHAGTLGGSLNKYIVLIIVGIFLTVAGNYLEQKIKNTKVSKSFILLAIILSFGTGMLSGGVQHYDDNTAYGSILLSVGLVITFLSLAYKDFKADINKKSILIIVFTSIILYLVLAFALPQILNLNGERSHHDDEVGAILH